MAVKSGEAQSPVDLESEILVRGEGQFTDDIAPHDALWGVFVRSQIAHGVITSIDISAAEDASGVVTVITAKELATAGCVDLEFAAPLLGVNGDAPTPYDKTPRPILASECVRKIGEPIVFVIAKSLAAAEDAAELVEVEIDELPANMSSKHTGPVEAPVWKNITDNQSFLWAGGDREAVDIAMSEANQTVNVTLRNQRLAGNPLETRAATASYEPASGRYTLYCPSQGTTVLQGAAATALGIEPAQLRVVTKNVGGGFGLKVYAFPEYIAVLAASKIVGKPVRWNSTRSEAFLSDQHGRDSSLKISGGFDDAGTLKAIDVDIDSNLGAYITGVGAWVQSTMIAECIVGPYLTQSVAIQTSGMLTNSGPVSPYRGSGRPEAAFMLERLMDRAARQIGIDRIEIRKKNLIPRDQLPYAGPLGQVYDSGDFAAVLDSAIEISNWSDFEVRREASLKKGLRPGIGCSLFLETAGPFPQEPVDFRVTEDGFVEMRIAAVSNGQRHVSTFTHILSQRLGIDISKIRIIAGDTDNVPAGPPTVGSRGTMLTGSAISNAAESAIERGREIVGKLSDNQFNDISYANGTYTIEGAGKEIKFLELPGLVAKAQENGKEIDTSLDGIEVFTSPGYSFPNGCHICEVEVDVDTGVVEILQYIAVDDCGTVINPPVVEGQIMGGIAQGIGQALMEELVYDDNGQLLTGTFMDYTMPRADDMPNEINLVDLPDPTPNNPLGAKGVGEAGTTGSLAAVVNAVEDALYTLGVEDLQMPLTPCRVWQSIQDAQH